MQYPANTEVEIFSPCFFAILNRQESKHRDQQNLLTYIRVFLFLCLVANQSLGQVAILLMFPEECLKADICTALSAEFFKRDAVCHFPQIAQLFRYLFPNSDEHLKVSECHIYVLPLSGKSSNEKYHLSQVGP